MPYLEFDRRAVKMLPLGSRKNKKHIRTDHVPLDAQPKNLNAQAERLIAEAAERILKARAAGRPAMLSFGAHTIKNGLGLVLIELVRRGWVTHLATNGAGVIHDWEFAFQGSSSEDVRANVAEGQFGNWQETGFYINLAINIGAVEGRGYGESVGALVEREGLQIPSERELTEMVQRELASDARQASAAAELLALVREFELAPGWLAVPHECREFCVQRAAFELQVPSTAHPMIGHDIIYNHPMNNGTLLGKAALRDFMRFANSVSQLTNGVYMSLGSAVMSPMIFEKSLSISQNVALQQGQRIGGHWMLVVDLAQSHWDWSQGEPPETNPDYYLRYCKTFARMGGEMRYLSSDNRDFLLALYQQLDRMA